MPVLRCPVPGQPHHYTLLRCLISSLLSLTYLVENILPFLFLYYPPNGDGNHVLGEQVPFNSVRFWGPRRNKIFCEVFHKSTINGNCQDSKNELFTEHSSEEQVCPCSRASFVPSVNRSNCRGSLLLYKDTFTSVTSSDLQIRLAVRNNIYFSFSLPPGAIPGSPGAPGAALAWGQVPVRTASDCEDAHVS